MLGQNMREPGIEPGPTPWQGAILPLDHSRFVNKSGGTTTATLQTFKPPPKDNDIKTIIIIMTITQQPL